MPLRTDCSQRPPQLSMPNGLRVRLLNMPEGSPAAALVRVHAGAHDAPEAYPGLAHFLEHLLFLGSQHYPVEQSLMPFVQACGGQLNASTRERHTDYFFQVPAERLEEGLWRLMDMLAQPLLDPAAQQREREVLHAEYLARAEDAETLCDAALGQALGSGHPFSAFHAGNRETLPVEDEYFQQALLGYHQRFYRTGQIELLLAAPQAHDDLLRMARSADVSLTAGPFIQREAPPLQHSPESWLRLQLDKAAPRLLLACALDRMPEHAQPALDYLSSWIASEAPEALLPRLRDEGLCQSLKLRVPYWYAGQGVVVIEAALTEQGLARRAQIVDALFDWLRFFAGEARWLACREEYRRVLQRSLQVAEPLARLKHWVEPQAWSDSSDEAAVRQALESVLEQIQVAQPIVLSTDTAGCEPVETEGFPLRLKFETPVRAAAVAWHWRQPQANPWLKASPRGTVGAINPGLQWLGSVDAAGRGALYLRCRFTASALPAGYWQAFHHALQSRVWAARQAGVELRFEDLGNAWLLRLYGIAEAIPLIVKDLGALLAKPPQTSLDQGPQLAERAFRLGGDELPIRQQLALLPRLLAGATSRAEQAPLGQSELNQHWRDAEWQGLAFGFAADLRGPLQSAITALPGQAVSAPPGLKTGSDGYHWHSLGAGQSGGETALLLFCPLPSEGGYGVEAAWRVLGRLLERAFFRRLRSELQLGYAVFSRFASCGDQAGMLFAVQSPSASAAEILGHIEVFLEDFATQLASQAVRVEEVARELSKRHVADTADLRAYAEQIGQAWLAGHGPEHPAPVAQAMTSLNGAQLLAALDVLRHGAGGWRVLANATAPDARWRCA